MITAMLGMPAAMAQEPTPDEILAKHFKAMGYENLAKINTVVLTGMIIQQDAMPVKITRMRPDKYVMQFDVQDVTAWQAWDGKMAWMTAPWTGNPKPQPMAADRAGEMKARADFDGLLFNWKSKGHVVELAGRDTVENAVTYKLKVTRSDGGTEYLFLDPETFVISKRMYYRMSRGKEVVMEIYFRDYRPVQGILYSFTQDTHFGGQPYNSLQLDAVELNLPVDEKIFNMP